MISKLTKMGPKILQSGISAITITYTRQGKGPYGCDYEPPCNWAGIYWLNPADNWGTIPGAGYDPKVLQSSSFGHAVIILFTLSLVLEV